MNCTNLISHLQTLQGQGLKMIRRKPPFAGLRREPNEAERQSGGG
jgi:hypothetical protein